MNKYLLGALLVIGLGLVYYVFIFSPNDRRQKDIDFKLAQQEQQKIDIADAQISYDSCVSTAQITFDGNWSANCLDKSNTDGCSIAQTNATRLQQELKDDRNLCEQHYQTSLEAIGKTY